MNAGCIIANVHVLLSFINVVLQLGPTSSLSLVISILNLVC